MWRWPPTGTIVKTFRGPKDWGVVLLSLGNVTPDWSLLIRVTRNDKNFGVHLALATT